MKPKKKVIVRKDYSDETDDEKTYENRQVSKVVYV